MQIMTKDPYAFGDDGGDIEDSGPSKSEIKRQMLALQDLGRLMHEMIAGRHSSICLPARMSKRMARLALSQNGRFQGRCESARTALRNQYAT